jgi:Holliday junction resolvase RusA-like endonuclease
MSADRVHRMIPKPLDGEPLRYGRLSLSMPPLSVNNLFANKGRGRFATKLYMDWQTRALIELRRQGGWHVPGPVCVRLQFTRKQTKADLDNLAKPVLDILVKAGRIADDRNVKELRMLFSDGVSGTQIDIWEHQLCMEHAPPKSLVWRAA